MKLMDENGRLFGRVNIIDLLIAVLIIGAGAFAFFVFGADRGDRQGETVIVDVEIKRMREEVCSGIQVGEPVYEKVNNELLGEVVSFTYSPCYLEGYSEIDGSFVKALVPDRFDLTVSLRVPKSASVPIGKSLSLRGKNFTGAGFVVGMREE